MENKSAKRHHKIIFLAMLLGLQISLFAQAVKVSGHSDPDLKKIKPVVTVPDVQPTNGCVSGNCIDGFGKMVKERNKEVYEGKWKNGMKEGDGTITDRYSTYTGNWHEDMYQGHGQIKEFIEHYDKMTIVRIYTGNFERFDYKGQGKCIMYTDWGTKIMFVMEGNFDSQQLLGKASLIIPKEGTYYSDNFTDNFNFTSGQFVKENTTQKVDGSLKNGFFKEANSTATDTKFTPATNTTKVLGPVAYKIYCFKTYCSSRGKNFYVISKITADIASHSFDEIKYEATHLVSINGWFSNSATDYLGIAEKVTIKGTPGKDYVISESGLWEFKTN